MNYARDGHRVDILHTEVDPSLRGSGAGARLVAAAVEWARVERHQIVPVCPFAKSIFARRPDYADVL
jgi:predicted GNAT family acetyltransferase